VQSKYEALVREAMDVPLNIQLQADGTPMTCMKSRTVKIDNVVFRRRNRISVEYFLSRVFASYTDSSGVTHMASHVMEPKVCMRKDTWRQFNALRLWLVMPRSLGHTGIVNWHCNLDGGLVSSLTRRVQQHIALQYEGQTTRRQRQLALREWVRGSWCGAHIASKAPNWSCKRFLADPRKDLQLLFKVVDGLRDAAELLTEVAWSSAEEFVVRDTDSHEGALYQFWRALRLPPVLLQEIVDLDLRVVDERYSVSHRHAGCPREDIVKRIRAVFVAVVALKKGSDTRWQGMCQMCVLLVSACEIGVDMCARKLCAQGAKYDWYLGAFRLLLGPLRPRS
jgi:hypothetical protein